MLCNLIFMNVAAHFAILTPPSVIIVVVLVPIAKLQEKHFS